jgi:uncharacterized protein (DUF1330 family)
VNCHLETQPPEETNMSAYIIVGFTPKDTDKLQQYGASVPPILAKYSGEILTKGPVEKLQGDFAHKIQVIITFPSREQALGWYNSAEYQALIPIRDQGMDSEFQLIG